MYTTIASWGYHDMLVIVAVNRPCDCVELFPAWFIWKFAWYLLVPWKLDLTRRLSGQFRLWVYWDLWNLHLKFIVYSAVEFYLLSCGTIKGNYDNLKCFGSLLNSPSQQLKIGLLLLVLRFLLDGLWLMKGTLPSQMRNFLLKYICIFTQSLMYCRYFQVDG